MLPRRLSRPIVFVAVTQKSDGTPTELVAELEALGKRAQEGLWHALKRMSAERLAHELREIPGWAEDDEGIWVDLELRVGLRWVRLVGQLDAPRSDSPPGARVVFKLVQLVSRPYVAELRRRYLGGE